MMAVYRDSLHARTPTPLRAALARMRAPARGEEEGTRAQTAQRAAGGEGGGARMGELQCSASQYDLSDSFIATGGGALLLASWVIVGMLQCLPSIVATHGHLLLLAQWVPVSVLHCLISIVACGEVCRAHGQCSACQAMSRCACRVLASERCS
jgi:hypothetical protein